MSGLGNFDVRSLIVNTVHDLFETMLDMGLDYIEQMSQSYLYGLRLMSSINLTGPVMGLINVQAGEGFCRKMTAAMLGVAPESIDDPDQVKDCLGEICNVIGGNLKSGLCDAGFECALTMPALITGKDYRMESRQMTRTEYFSFYHGDSLILVEVGLMEADTPEPSADVSGQTTLPGASILEGFDVEASIRNAMNEVFDTMLDMDIAESDPTAAIATGNRIVASIGMAGRLRGRVNLVVPEPFSRRMAATMLDAEPEDLDDSEAITDVIGEICNMITGGLKSDLDDVGVSCRLSPPSITEGNDFETEFRSYSQLTRLCFIHAGEAIVVEVGLRPDESASNPPGSA